MASNITRIEKEVVILKAIWEMIDEMVNYEMFLQFNRTVDAELHFNTVTHQRLFNILLVDFLSQPRKWPFGLILPPPGVSKSQRSILFHLKGVCDDPQLNPRYSDALRSPLDAFTQWLEGECLVNKVWFPSIEVETDIKVRRIEFIKICGNIAKHNFTRLSANVSEIIEILRNSGVIVAEDQGYLVLPEFYEWFHRDIFSYHSSAIAEFLNNIRWGIYHYLRPEFIRSFTKDDPASIEYRFEYPPECSTPVVRTMYWDLMNEMRSEPYMQKFEVTRFLKMRY